MHQSRTRIAERYLSALRSIDELQVPRNPESGTHAWHLFMLRIREDKGINRDELHRALVERGIGTSVHFIPLHVQPYYRDTYKLSAGLFPLAYREFKKELSLPIFSSMTMEEVDWVIDAVVDSVAALRRRQRVATS
jgi:dTDP-4-amino-4,6-dideoxygalactose transaminase